MFAASKLPATRSRPPTPHPCHAAPLLQEVLREFFVHVDKKHHELGPMALPEAAQERLERVVRGARLALHIAPDWGGMRLQLHSPLLKVTMGPRPGFQFVVFHPDGVWRVHKGIVTCMCFASEANKKDRGTEE